MTNQTTARENGAKASQLSKSDGKYSVSLDFKKDHYRPWIANYPQGIEWDVPIDVTPVHFKVLSACGNAPNENALDFLGAKTTFSTLEKQIKAFAGALQHKYGIKKGDRIALLLPNTPFYPVAYYAALSIGATVVNCNPLYTIPELTFIVKDAGAKLMVTLDLKQLFDKAEQLCEDGHVEQLIVCHFPEALPKIKRALFSVAKRGDLKDVANSKVADRVDWFSELLAENHNPTFAEIDPITDIAVQQYTGGTTGVPKGAMLTHANIAANLDQIEKWGCRRFYPPSKVVAVLPFFHIFAMTVCLNVPLGNGIEVVMLPRFELKGFLDLVHRTGANILPAVPTLLHAIATNRKTKPELLNSLNLIISGGAPMADEVRAEFAKISPSRIAEGYGLTECSPVVCCEAVEEESKPQSIGLPIPGTDIAFADLDDPSQLVAPGERGELLVRGAQVMAGYFNNPEATKEAFQDGYFRTGDVGYVDEDGYVFLVDRIKDLIICSGFNVYPRSIEDALYHHESVDECNVIGVKDDYRGEAPIAFIKLKEGKTATSTELKSFLSERISRIEMPREFIFKDELPKTLIGKLSKKELRVEYAEKQSKGPEDDDA